MNGATLNQSDQQSIAVIVDDIAENREILQRYLEASGYATRICVNGREAITLISQEKPDIVLLDWMMPELDGIQTLAAIRERYDPATLPVIMCTAIGEEVSVIGAFNAGANDYITKPINLPVLRARMRHHLQQQAIVETVRNDRQRAEETLSKHTRRLFENRSAGVQHE